jgi:hypothetical protein
VPFPNLMSLSLLFSFWNLLAFSSATEALEHPLSVKQAALSDGTLGGSDPSRLTHHQVLFFI